MEGDAAIYRERHAAHIQATAEEGHMKIGDLKPGDTFILEQRTFICASAESDRNKRTWIETTTGTLLYERDDEWIEIKGRSE